MHLLITGGFGFLGQQLARRLLAHKSLAIPTPAFANAPKPLTQLTLFDTKYPNEPLPSDVETDERVRVMIGDITEPGVADELIDEPEMAVVHLASMVSGDSEADPERAWHVNVEGHRRLLEAVRHNAPGARFLFTSSTATFGALPGGAPAPSDATKQLPQNTYGFHKVVCEMMLNEYSRRGWVDGRGLRLPVIVVRPGAPNKAATTCWSSAVREPLAGVDARIPVPAGSRLPVASYQAATSAMQQLLSGVDGAELGHDRMLTLPSLSLTPAELHAAAVAEGSRRGLAHVGALVEEVDELASTVVGSMSASVDGSRGRGLGLESDSSASSIVGGYAVDVFDCERSEVRAPPEGDFEE